MDKELQFLIYNTPEENVSVNAVIKDETIWLTQKAMAELFGVGVPAISKHLANIYAEGELNEISTVSKMEIVQQEGSRDIKRNMEFYNLDAIISVGYRVNSRKATNFRIWATGILKEYMIKGFAMDDERLKQGKTAFGKDYFKELLERVRSIRASERRIWQQITDIFAECSIDYELIAEMCPDGVQSKKISELCCISRGIVISKEDISNNVGDYPVYSSQTENNGELGKINTYAYDGEYLTWTTDGANAGTVFYREGKFNVTNVCGLLQVINSDCMIKYLYHVLKVEAPKYVRRGMGNPKLMSNVSNFVWSIFYSLLEQVVSVLNVPEESDRETDKLNQLEYIFIDDPVTSLDDNHLIQMAVNLSDVICKSESDLKFIITTHSPLFYNVLYNELKIKNNNLLIMRLM